MIVTRTYNHLRRKVFWCAAEGVRFPCLRTNYLCHPKVCQLDVPIFVEQDVLGLEVTVYDSRLVQITEGDSDLRRVELCLIV